MDAKQPAVYMMTNKPNGILYVGVTSNLIKRIYEHKHRVMKGFTAKYNCNLLVWYEIHDQFDTAIPREKQLKAGSRQKKLLLIEAMNPAWTDLYPQLF